MKILKALKRTKKYLSLSIAVLLGIALVFFAIDAQSFKIPIFGFHSIFDRTNPDRLPSRAAYLDYSVQDLEEFLEYLIQEKYWFLSSQDFYDYFLVKAKTIPEQYIGQRPVMLTFDDGYENINAFVLPLLEKLEEKYNLKIPIVLFLNPAFMERKKSQSNVEYLNCDRIKDGFNRGFYDVQSAGVDHANLTKISISDLEFELRESQRKLQECIAETTKNTVALHFAYPYNRVNSQVTFYTAQYYRSGYLYNDKIQRINRFHHNYRISRVGISRRDPPQKLIDRARQASKIRLK
jgi:peptidoglycan/xylan/chitin deacetylase (PgdA/CDA1 family)